jgi:hypothetical protein
MGHPIFSPIHLETLRSWKQLGELGDVGMMFAMSFEILHD